MARLKIKAKIIHKDCRHKNIEKLADVLNCIYEDNQIYFQFRDKYNEWSDNFSMGWKSLEIVKSGAMKNLKSFNFSGILVTAILFLCVLEYCRSSDTSYLILSFSLYASISVMKLVSYSRISYSNSPDKQTSEICHFFKNIFVMSQALESRLNTLRRRFKMNIRLPLDYHFRTECDFHAIINPNVFSYNIASRDLYGMFLGATTFLLCHFFKLDIFDILEVFTLYLMFICAICYDIKISGFIKKINQAKNTLNFVTKNFFIWFENDCQLKKILQQNEIREDLSGIIHSTTPEIQQNFRYLNSAIVVAAIQDIQRLNLSKNDMENILMFLIHEKFTALNKVTYKKLNTGYVMKCPLEVNYSNQDYLKANSSISTPSPATTEKVLAKSRFTKSKQFERYADQSDFVNRIKCDAKYEAKIDKKVATKYIEKLNSNSGAESGSVTFKNGSQAKKFDETLQLRPELRSSGSKKAYISTKISSNVTSSEFDETHDQDLFHGTPASENNESSKKITVSNECVNHNYYGACCALTNLMDPNIESDKTTLIKDNEEINEDPLNAKESKNVSDSDKEEFLTNDDNLTLKVKNTNTLLQECENEEERKLDDMTSKSIEQNAVDVNTTEDETIANRQTGGACENDEVLNNDNETACDNYDKIEENDKVMNILAGNTSIGSKSRVLKKSNAEYEMNKDTLDVSERYSLLGEKVWVKNVDEVSEGIANEDIELHLTNQLLENLELTDKLDYTDPRNVDEQLESYPNFNESNENCAYKLDKLNSIRDADNVIGSEQGDANIVLKTVTSTSPLADNINEENGVKSKCIKEEIESNEIRNLNKDDFIKTKLFTYFNPTDGENIDPSLLEAYLHTLNDGIDPQYIKLLLENCLLDSDNYKNIEQESVNEVFKPIDPQNHLHFNNDFVHADKTKTSFENIEQESVCDIFYPENSFDNYSTSNTCLNDSKPSIVANDTNPSFDSGLNSETLLETPENDISEGSSKLVCTNEYEHLHSDEKAKVSPSLSCLVLNTQDLPNRKAEVLNTRTNLRQSLLPNPGKSETDEENAFVFGNQTNLRQSLLPNPGKSETDKENAFVFGNEDSSACSKELDHCYKVNEQEDEFYSAINESLKGIPSDENEKVLIDNTEEFNAEKTSVISSRKCTKKKQQSTRKKNSFGRKNKGKGKIKADKMISELKAPGGNLVNKLDDTDTTLRLSDDLEKIKPENEPEKDKVEINDERCESNFGTQSFSQPELNSKFRNNSNLTVTERKVSGEMFTYPSHRMVFKFTDLPVYIYTDPNKDLALESCADNISTKQIVSNSSLDFEIKDENRQTTSFTKDCKDYYKLDYSISENFSGETSLRTVIDHFSNKIETGPVTKDFVENLEESKEKSYETKETNVTIQLGTCEEKIPDGDINSTDSNTSLVKNLRKFVKGKRRFNHLPVNATTEPSISTLQNENVRKSDQTNDYHEDKHVKDNSIDNCNSKPNHETSLNERKILIADKVLLKNSENESQNSYSDESLSQENSQTFNESSSCTLTTESQCNPEQKTNDVILDRQCNLEKKTSQVSVNIPAVDESGYVHLESENEATKQIKIENISRTVPAVLEHLDGKNTNYKDAKDVEHDRSDRMKLHYLWKTEERSQIVEIFPKHRFAIKRIIGRLEKQLGSNKKGKAYCLSTTSIEDSKIPLETIDESEYYLKCSSTKTFEQYGSPNEDINREESTQNWIKSQAITNEVLQGYDISETPPLVDGDIKVFDLSSQGSTGFMNTATDTEIPTCTSRLTDCNSTDNKGHSLEGMLDSEIFRGKLLPKTPPTGSSEDANFHFHPSTSPSDTSSEYSEQFDDSLNTISDPQLKKSQPTIYKKESDRDVEKVLKIDDDENDDDNLQMLNVDAQGMVRWCSDLRKEISDRDINSLNTSFTNIYEDTPVEFTINGCSSQNGGASVGENLAQFHENHGLRETDNHDEFTEVKKQIPADDAIMQQNGEIIPKAESHLSFNDSQSVMCDGQIADGLQKSDKHEPQRFHLQYEDLDLCIVDSSPNVTIRLVGEKDNCHLKLIPKYHLVSNSLSSSCSSLNELTLCSTQSSSIIGESNKDYINITRDNLNMTVQKESSNDIPCHSESQNILENNSIQNFQSNSECSYDIPCHSKSQSIPEDDSIQNVQNNSDCSNDIPCLSKSQNILENNSVLSADITHEGCSKEQNEDIIEDDESTEKVFLKKDINENNQPVAEEPRNHVIDELESTTHELGNFLDEFGNNVDKLKMAETVNVDHTDGENETSACSLINKNNNIVGSKTSNEEPASVASVSAKHAIISEENGDLLDEVLDENTKDFCFESKNVKLNYSPVAGLDSIDIKFRQVQDKTKLTFKSPKKKLYVKMTPHS